MSDASPIATISKPRRLRIVLVQVGESFNYDVDRIAKILNKVALPWLEFRHKRLEINDFDEYELADHLQIGLSPFWDAAKAMELLQQATTAEDDSFVVGITPAWLADDPVEGKALETKDSYFGYWSNRYVPALGKSNYAIISTAMWQSRYERAAYRDVNQYIVHLLVAAIGDYVIKTVKAPNQDWPGLTHSIYQSCTFDFTPDLDSIVPAVQRSRICGRCRDRINHKNVELRISERPLKIIEGLDRLLAIARVPPHDQVFRALQEDPRFSIIAISCLLSLFVGNIGTMLSSSAPVGVGVSVLCAAALILIWWRKRKALTGRPLP